MRICLPVMLPSYHPSGIADGAALSRDEPLLSPSEMRICCGLALCNLQRAATSNPTPDP